MANKTKFGFAGRGPPSSLQPALPSPGAQTVYGREDHGSAPLAPPALTESALGPVPSRDVEQPKRSRKSSRPPASRPPRIRRPSGKTRFPALAGFWGRRNTQGDLVPMTDPGMRFILRPRHHRFVRPLFIVLLAALISFLLVILFMKVGGT